MSFSNNIINISNDNSQRIISSNNFNDINNDELIQLNEDNNFNIKNENYKNINIELNTISNSSSSNGEDKLSDKESIEKNENNNIISPKIKENDISNKIYYLLFYGNNYNDLKPRYIGYMYAFCYFKGKPLIVIGPNCKKYLII